MTVQTGINNISNEWFKPIIDKKVLKSLSKRSDYEGWKHILTFFSCLFILGLASACLLYTSPSPRDRTRSRMPSSA